MTVNIAEIKHLTDEQQKFCNKLERNHQISPLISTHFII